MSVNEANCVAAPEASSRIPPGVHGHWRPVYPELSDASLGNNTESWGPLAPLLVLTLTRHSLEVNQVEKLNFCVSLPLLLMLNLRDVRFRPTYLIRIDDDTEEPLPEERSPPIMLKVSPSIPTETHSSQLWSVESD